MTFGTTRPVATRARFAVFGLFTSFGVLLAIWAVHLPTIKHAVGMSTSMMGTMLLVLGVGSVIGMQLTGVLVDRFGGEAVAILGGAAMAVALVVPLTAESLVPVLYGALVFGVTAGIADVAMNAVAVNVQRDYARPIMASFHGMFSVGAVIGSLLGAGGFAIHLDGGAAALAVGWVCVLTVAGAAVGLRGRYLTDRQLPAPEDGAPAKVQTGRGRHVLLLGMLAFLLLLSEGSAMDWASLHAQQRLGASPSTGAFVVASFLVAMMLSRFVIDRVTARVGAVRVLRAGALVAAMGMLVVIVSTSVPLLICGWIVVGLGLAVGVPQVFTAAGNVSAGRAGRDLSRVVGVGYVAIMAGPSITGWLIELVSWTGAFLVPLVALLVCALSASVVGTSAQPETEMLIIDKQQQRGCA